LTGWALDAPAAAEPSRALSRGAELLGRFGDDVGQLIEADRRREAAGDVRSGGSRGGGGRRGVDDEASPPLESPPFDESPAWRTTIFRRRRRRTRPSQRRPWRRRALGAALAALERFPVACALSLAGADAPDAARGAAPAFVAALATDADIVAAKALEATSRPR
jgi:hypothetical protein